MIIIPNGSKEITKGPQSSSSTVIISFSSSETIPQQHWDCFNSLIKWSLEITQKN